MAEQPQVPQEQSKSAEETTPKQKIAPRVRVRNRGVVSGSLDGFAERYREQFPDRDCRWAYDPTHKPELSTLMAREADGYRLVRWEELAMDGKKEGEAVRVADLVLVSISKKEKMEIVAGKIALAREQRERVQREFYEAQDQQGAANKPAHHSRNPMKAMGSVSIIEKEHEYDVEQRGGEGE